MEIVIFGILGLCFGSFINALVWRLRHKRDFVRERSECTHCHHVLEWNDLIPVVSWVMLRGKCRYCHKPIEDSPIVEATTAVLFIVSYISWPYGFETVGMLVFGLWLIAIVLLVALSLYDIRWYLLPDRLVIPLTALGLIIGSLVFYSIKGVSVTGVIIEMLFGVVVISGLYFILHYVSGGKWVGFGDVKLGVFMGLILGWQGALLALFLANVLGLLFVLPLLVTKKIGPKSKIPFGPFLIASCYIAFLFGEKILNWYFAGIIGI